MKFHMFDNDRYLFNTLNSDNDRYKSIVDHTIFECNNSLEIVRRGLPRKKDSYESVLYEHSFFVRGNTVYYHPVYCDTIYSIHSNGTIKAEFAIDFGKKTVPEQLRKGDRRKRLREEQANSRYAFMSGDIHLTDRYLHFGYSKAHRGHDCIYSLEDNHLVSFHSRSGYFPLIFANIVGSTDVAFIGYIFPAMVLPQMGDWKNIPYDSLVNEFGKERADLGLSMKDDDNPIVTFFYKK